MTVPAKSNKTERAVVAVTGNGGRPDGFISQYHKDLQEWSKNVDQRYAWVILFALFLTFFAILGSYRMYGLIFAQVTINGHYTREQASWPVSMIFSSENISGPLVSVIAYHIPYRTSLFIGGSLVILCNSLTYFSDSLITDILLIGIFQGFGYAFVFMPYMELINSYFLKYRNIALGLSLSGGTLSVFALTPLFRYVLDNYHWRAAYLLAGGIGCGVILMVPLLRPNPKPSPQSAARPKTTDMSIRALTYQTSLRRQSTMLMRTESQRRRNGSIVSVNPFASSVGAERKISRAINDNSFRGGTKPHIQRQQSSSTADQLKVEETLEHKSLHDIEVETVESGGFKFSIILDILKTPGFHVIWYLELTYYWIFSIFCLVLVDFGVDRGCTRSQAEDLLMFQSLGELIGRIGLTVLADMQFLSVQNTVALDLVLLTITLCYLPIAQSYYALAGLTLVLNALASLVYILLNGLLVDKLGEQKVTIGYGMASCVVGILVVFRPQAVGFFRDYVGSYEWLMISLGAACAIGAFLVLLEGCISRRCRKESEAAKGPAFSNA